jgi:hypothetical protein
MHRVFLILLYYKLRASLNVGLKNVFGPAREEMIGEKRKLHYGEVSNLC